ncbi:MAG: hypothetical protein HY898_01550 [Deltaproteobacteria bacterium]|nr:hypothetical protein [Deltaproteobacteria bacterium]
MTPARFALAILLGSSIASAAAVAAAGMGTIQSNDRPRYAPAIFAPPAQSASDGGTNEQKVPAEVMVLHATNTDGGIDPRIGPMPELKKPPFSAYNTYKLIERTAITLTPSQPATAKLPNNRVLRTSLMNVLPNQRFRISSSISQPHPDAGRPNFLPLLEVTARSGETFFVAGQSYQGGVLVVGIKVGK